MLGILLITGFVALGVAAKGGSLFGQNAGLGVSSAFKRQSGIQNITDSNLGHWYGVNVTFGTQELTLLIDTGSSDTWVFSSDTKCMGTKSNNEEDNLWGDATCSFGPRYQGSFPQEVTSEHEYFSTEYWTGEVINGTLGLANLTVAGLPVINQTVGLADNASRWLDSGPSSGVLGLAYPGLTRAFIEFDDFDDMSLVQEYSPVFTKMVAQGVTEGFFSLALSRPGSSSESAGTIAFGGVAEELEGVDYGTVAQTDIIIANVDDKSSSQLEYSYYTIIADGWHFDGSSDNRSFVYIINSNTPFISLPSDLVFDIAKAFDPPARQKVFHGVYWVDCDATAPEIAVVINGTSFWLNPVDLVIQSPDNPENTLGPCFIAFNDGGGPWVLGSPFLKNVLAVFDMEDAVM
ncbi:hypothetical protein diail_4280, partial [Diaporthe ilicicola]